MMTRAPPPPTASYTVSFSPASQTVDERVGTVNVLVSITPTPDGPIVVPITVDSSVAGIVHASPDDYILPTPSNVIFDTTTTEVSFEVMIIDDGEPEEIDDETIVLIFDVGSLANVVVGTPDRSTITIVDDDTAPPDATEYTVSFDTASLVVDEGVGTVAVMVSITPTPFIADGAIVVPIIVDISVVGIVHASPDDYTLPTPSNVIFDATTTEASFEVMITDDDPTEMMMRPSCLFLMLVHWLM